MNPSEWSNASDKSHLYYEVLRRSQERFFVCECRFGTFKLRSALENVFLLRAHENIAVHSLAYEKIRIPYERRTYIPDFFVNGEHIVECKAKRDQVKKEVVEKAMAGEYYAYHHDFLYHMLDFDQFDEFFELL